MCIDPITAAGRTAQPWISDLAFLKSVKKTAVGYGCSVVLITHPQHGVTEPSRENLAGSAAYERFTDTILTVHGHDAKESQIQTDCGRTTAEHNRTVRIEKARNGKGNGCRLAFQFDGTSLQMKELGLILRRESRPACPIDIVPTVAIAAGNSPGRSGRCRVQPHRRRACRRASCERNVS